MFLSQGEHFLFFYFIYIRSMLTEPNQFTVHINQTIILNSLNVYSDICQLFLNRTGVGGEETVKLLENNGQNI